jgi:hypothetical protein
MGTIKSLALGDLIAQSAQSVGEWLEAARERLQQIQGQSRS